MLTLIYAVNDLGGKAGYALTRSREARNDEAKARYFAHHAKLKLERIRLNGTLKALCKATGYTMKRNMGGRIFSIYSRVPARGQGRPPGALVNISQKGLFAFAGLYSEEDLTSLVLNEIMFRETP